MVFSDAAAPDRSGRDIQADRRQGQQARTARSSEATTIRDGDFIVENGAGVIVKGGEISAEYPSGRSAAYFGPLVIEGTAIPSVHGLLVQADEDVDLRY